jgi:hypothetical protein
VGNEVYFNHKCRRDDVTLTRLRIGHTYVTHSYLLRGKPQPQCIPCDCPYTVKHILTECADLIQTRQLFYSDLDLKSILDTPLNVINFIKAIGLYRKI